MLSISIFFKEHILKPVGIACPHSTDTSPSEYTCNESKRSKATAGEPAEKRYADDHEVLVIHVFVHQLLYSHQISVCSIGITLTGRETPR